MKKLEVKKEIHVLIDQLPEEDLNTIKRLIKFFIAEREEKIVLEPLEPEEKLRPEFVERLRLAEQEIERGEVYTLDEVARELGYEHQDK